MKLLEKQNWYVIRTFPKYMKLTTIKHENVSKARLFHFSFHASCALFAHSKILNFMDFLQHGRKAMKKHIKNVMFCNSVDFVPYFYVCGVISAN
jgi:hypothetical protein